MLLEIDSYLNFASYHCELLSDHRRDYEGSPETLPATMAEFRRDLLSIKAAQAWISQAVAQEAPSEAVLRLCAEFPRAGAGLLLTALPPRENLSWLESGVAAERSLPGRPEPWDLLSAMGEIHGALGENELAVTRAIEAHEAAKLFDEGGRLVTLHQLGALARQYGDRTRALKLWTKILPDVESTANPRLRATLLRDIADVMVHLDRSGLDHLPVGILQSIFPAQLAKLGPQMIDMLKGYPTSNLCMWVDLEGAKVARALELWGESAEAFRQCGGHRECASVLCNMAEAIAAEDQDDEERRLKRWKEGIPLHAVARSRQGTERTVSGRGDGIRRRVQAGPVRG